MRRREFIKSVMAGFNALVLYHMLPPLPALAAAEKATGEGRHFRTLRDITLQEIAANRLHHGTDGRFHNPLGRDRRRSNLGRVLYWKLFHENEFAPYLAQQPLTPVRVDWDALEKSDGLSVTFIKHASVLIKDVDAYLIVDPIFDDLFWFIKDHSPLAFGSDEMPKVDHILLTHGHYDHASRPSLASFDPGTHVISPLGYDGLFNSLGMHHRTPLDWYQSYRAGGRHITLLPCNHWTMRNPIIGPNRSLWGSYIIETAGGKTIYISGDTAFFDGFHQIGRQFDIDLAIINLGAYEPRWFMAPSHMNPRETLTAFKQLRAKQLMVIHWGTFRLGDEPVHFPPMQLRRLMDKEGLSDRLLDVGHGRTLYLT